MRQQSGPPLSHRLPPSPLPTRSPPTFPGAASSNLTHLDYRLVKPQASPRAAPRSERGADQPEERCQGLAPCVVGGVARPLVLDGRERQPARVEERLDALRAAVAHQLQLLPGQLLGLVLRVRRGRKRGSWRRRLIKHHHTCTRERAARFGDGLPGAFGFFAGAAPLESPPARRLLSPAAAGLPVAAAAGVGAATDAAGPEAAAAAAATVAAAAPQMASSGCGTAAATHTWERAGCMWQNHDFFSE